MRNLSLIDKQVIPCLLLGNCVAATVEGSVLYFVSGNELCKLNLELSNFDENVEVLVPLDSSNPDDSVIDLKYLPEEDTLVLVSKSGAVTVYNVDSSDTEVVGDVAGGISACCWSPDMETLVIITNTGNILMMSRTWEVLNEVGLHQEDFGEGKFITVGWGSKETQFHGSEGKESRVKKEVDGKLADWDDKATRIVWRADGLFFAINAVNPSLGFRVIRVFNREGQLQYTSEKVEQLEQSLSWKSSGASGLITSGVSLVQQGKQQVAFFEKNGLRHGEFEISAGSKVLESYWNGDSTILALFVELGSKEYVIQLWTTSNYYWSMKQLIRFESGTRPLWLSWDAIDVNRLHFVSSVGEYVKMDLKFTVDSSRGLTSSDLACVAVIDNCKLKLTLLREAVIPPPMCAWELELPGSINQVAFQTRDSNHFAALTSDKQIFLFKLTNDGGEHEEKGVKITRREGRIFRPVLLQSYTMDAVDQDFYHWKWIDETVMAGCFMNKLIILGFESNNVTIRKSFELEKRITALVPSRDQKMLFAQLIDGSVYQVDLDGLVLSAHGTRLPELCLHLDCINGLLIGLTANGRLYCDGKEILNTVSSFAIHSNFLLVTSAQHHQLICAELDKLIPFSSEISSQRRIERGARLVHAVAMDTKVVLQMPRGNLEAIHPRALTLNILSRLINQKSYADAFDLMKKQRINLNLLYDHNPQQWLQNCPEFIEQVGSLGLANLNLFLSELQDEDFTTTMYQEYYRDRVKPPLANKVETICCEMRKIMEELDSAKYLLPILTSHVRQGEIHLALKAVQKVESESVKDDALKYLAVLVDTAKLYVEALATYDLQLSLMVANRSQMDPKEYLPFLNELDAMTDLHMRRFTIDNSLKRYESAARHLCRCQPIRTSEIVSYMKLHRTYAAVIDELCLAHSSETEQVLQTAAALQADSLIARSNFEEAGYVYQRAGLYEKALSAFQQCGAWNNCLSLATLLNMEQTKLRDVITALVKQLKSTRKYRDAAHLCEMYLQDNVQSAQCLIEGLHFSEAWALTCRHSLQEFRETALKDAIIEAIQVTEDRLQQVQNECSGYTTRLAVVRQNLLHKLENPVAETDHGDLFSETGSSIFTMSGTSGSGSGKTFRSSKNRRKFERKKLQLKEGSAFEDLALIHQLYQLHLSVNTILDDIGSILRGGMLILKDWQQLQQLQKKCECFVKFMESQKKEIWNFQPLKKDEDQNNTYGPSSTAEGIISQLHKEKENYFSNRYLELDPKMRYAPDVISDGWKMDVLK